MWVEQLDNGKYKFFERYKDPYTEKWRRVSLTLGSGSSRAKKEAQKLLDEKIENILASLQAPDVLFTDVLDEWWGFYQKEIKRSSISSLTGNVDELRSIFATNVKIRNIDARYIQNFLNNLKVTRSKLERFKSILNLSFDYALSLDYIKDNSARRAKLPKVVKTIDDYQKTAKKFLEDTELEKLIKELYRRPNTYRLALLAEFMAYNGCRIGEAIAIKPENINFKNKTIDIHGTLDKTVGYTKGEKTTTKTSASWRTVAMSDKEIDILHKMIDLNELTKNTNPNYVDLGYIFATKNGIPIQNNSFNTAIRSANQRLNIPIDKHLTSHIFRHTLVSRLAEYNIPLKAIMQRVGHSDSKTTLKIYTHVTQKMEANVVKLLNTLSS
ncbi:tyrosine-type recombinase/integrase [Streptococcus constellatus]|uniref:tyrosine-type recombinase/integrase n=1 Tax=Streptococcus constellatus TaxID=76860 RepID=UPI002000AE68|nr:site-specific integrase [Streptococcus constellatus]